MTVKYRAGKARVIYILVFVAQILWSVEAHSLCSARNGWTEKDYALQIPNLSISRDTPVNSVIYTQTLAFYTAGVVYAQCTGTNMFYGRYRNGWVANSSTGVAPTNIEGVGIRITETADYVYGGNYNTRRVFGSATMDVKFGFTGSVPPKPPTVELIKTGPIKSGAFTTGRVVGINVNNIYWMSSISISGGSVSSTGCTVNNTSITVPMGVVQRTAFSGVGSTSPITSFDIPLSCDDNTKVNITFNATHDASAAPGVIALNSSGGVGVASGVGIQLLSGNVPVILGASTSIGTVSGETYIVPLGARYYQTQGTVTAGQANGTATFTLTYN